MDPNRKLTKKELKEQRRLQRLQQAANPQGSGMSQNTKWIVLGVVIVLFLGLFGYVVYSAKQETNRLENLPKNFSSAGWIRGDKSAPNTLIEFADFQCPHCKEYEPWVEQVLQQNKGKLKLQYKYFPLSFKYSYTTARAAQAAGNQGKFWQMHDLLFDKQTDIAQSSSARDLINGYASSLGLDMTKFNKDFDAKETSDIIQKIKDEGTMNGVNGTPTFFVNGKFVPLVNSYDEFNQEITAQFKQ